jgi:hypothetical protein
MRTRTALSLAAAASLLAGAALAGPPSAARPSAAKAGPTCEAAARQDREAANLASLVESLKRLERSRKPGADEVVALDNRGYNYGEPLVPFPELPRPR